uniref:Uncharacterized protein n=1 Tax=Glossina morsitans morsitans TaxID=37546 RepID=A0A1B0G3D2_GLOMM
MKRFLRGNETIERLNIKKICDNVQTIYITLVTADEDKVAQAMKTCSSSLLQCKDDKHLLNDSISESALHLHLNISNVPVAGNRSITPLIEKENMLTILYNEQSRYQG